MNEYDDNNIPYGKSQKVKAPWGSMEKANVFHMNTINGKNKEKYAVVMYPKGNPHVRCSVFRIT